MPEQSRQRHSGSGRIPVTRPPSPPDRGAAAAWSDLRLPAVLAGDRQAWDAFVARHARIVYAAIHRALAGAARDPEAAEDIFQDVFVRLCRNDMKLLRAYDPARASLPTWLAVIARSATIDHLRRQRGDHDPIEDAEAIPAPPEAERVRLRIPPDLLTPRQQAVLTMIYNRDMDVEEIATALGIERQTVRSTHFKALERLRAHFGETTP